MRKLDKNEVRKLGVYIQGDVVLFPTCATLGAGVDCNGILAEGEQTGHAHRVRPDQAMVLVSDLPAVLWLRSLGVEHEKPLEVSHEEHETLKLPNQNYLSWGQKEYSWVDGLRRVAD